jgi:DNA repair protein SbcD/Mre11
MTILTFADPHLSDKAPASRTDNYEAAILGKLDQIAQIACKVKARAVICSGDFFHRKAYVPHRLVAAYLNWARNLWEDGGVHVLGIAGNHDLIANRLASLPTQPLGVLFQSEWFTNVAETPWTLDRVTVVGAAYPDATVMAQLPVPPERTQPQQVRILVMHAFAGLEGGEWFGATVHRYADLARLPYDVFVFGHDHRDQGVVQVDGKWFINVGALARGSIGKADLVREIKIGLINTDDVFRGAGVAVQQVKLKVAPASEVFNLEVHAQRSREARDVEAFLVKLEQDLLAGPTRTELDRLAALDVPDAVRQRVRAYLDAAEAAGS